MKLRKDQRYTIYCIMLAEIETNLEEYEHGGLCYLFTRVLNYPEIYVSSIPTNDQFNFYSGFEMFPEVLKYKKDERDWFINWAERIKALKQCIAETENF